MMIKPPYIQAIYIASKAGSPMESVPYAKIISSGIESDRYASGCGAYSNTVPSKIRHISLITESGIAIANEWLAAGEEPTFHAAETRRNIVIANMGISELNQLIGKTFSLGEIVLTGTELCTPCQRPAQLQNKPSFLDAFAGRGGLRAEIIKIGSIAVGDLFSLSAQENK